MPQTLIIPTALRNFTDNQETITVEGKTVEELIEKLDARHSGFRQRIFEKDRLRRFVNIYVDGEDIRFLNNLATPVRDGAEVSIVLAVAGG